MTEHISIISKDLNGTIARVTRDTDLLLSDEQSTLDLIATVHYTHDCTKIIMAKEDIEPRFFQLKTRLLGNIMQKLVNYGFSLAIIGDFDHCESKNFRDFMRESNRGHTLFFVSSEDEAIGCLTQ